MGRGLRGRNVTKDLLSWSEQLKLFFKLSSVIKPKVTAKTAEKNRRENFKPTEVGGEEVFEERPKVGEDREAESEENQNDQAFELAVKESTPSAAVTEPQISSQTGQSKPDISGADLKSQTVLKGEGEKETSAAQSFPTFLPSSVKSSWFKRLSKKVPDQKGGFISSSYDMGQEYRVIAWNARLLSIGFVGAMGVIVGLSVCLFSLFPLKEIRPYLIGLRDKGDQVVHIEPVYKTVPGLKKLKESLCRHYVTLRETIDGQSEEGRWRNELYYFCSEEIWLDFKQYMNPQLATSPYKQCLDQKATRSVKILMSSPIARDIYRVEWELTTTIRGQVVEKSHWVSTMTVEMRPNTVNQASELINSLGFTVVGYTVAPWEGQKEKS